MPSTSQVRPAVDAQPLLDAIVELFDTSSDIVFFAKNAEAQYELVNDALVDRAGASDAAQLLGKTAAQIFPKPLGDSYLEQDRRLIASGTPLRNELEVHLDANGETVWCLTTKLPVRDPSGACVGLVGVSRDLPTGGPHAGDTSRFARVLRQAREHPDEPLTLGDLAQRAGVSAYRFDRKLRALLGITTGQWVVRVRMETAIALLRTTELSVADIAQSCGYSDQSAFTRQFRRTSGLTPLRFRTMSRRSENR